MINSGTDSLEMAANKHSDKIMQNFEAQLTDLAYTIFPKGVGEGLPEYLESVENRKLLCNLTAKPKASLFLDKIGRDIQAAKPEYDFENISIIYKYDRCVKGRFSSPHDSFLVYISLIIPYYVVYRQSWIYLPKTSQEMNDCRFFMVDLTQENQFFKRQISLAVEKYFMGYQGFPIELLNTQVRDIMSDGNGMLESFPKIMFNPMTFFNVFFSDIYF